MCEVAFRKYLETSDFDRHLSFLKALNRERRQLGEMIIKKFFPEGTVVWMPQGGFLLWVELPQRIDIEAAYHLALGQNVAFSRGSAFYTSSDEKVNAIRINCSRPTREQLATGLEILGKILSR
jgi:DNA-binding transcriptional MocR family regulator